jgi:hypothetical protein
LDQNAVGSPMEKQYFSSQLWTFSQAASQQTRRFVLIAAICLIEQCP